MDGCGGNGDDGGDLLGSRARRDDVHVSRDERAGDTGDGIYYAAGKLSGHRGAGAVF